MLPSSRNARTAVGGGTASRFPGSVGAATATMAGEPPMGMKAWVRSR